MKPSLMLACKGIAGMKFFLNLILLLSFLIPQRINACDYSYYNEEPIKAKVKEVCVENNVHYVSVIFIDNNGIPITGEICVNLPKLVPSKSRVFLWKIYHEELSRG